MDNMPWLTSSEGIFEVSPEIYQRWVTAGSPSTRGLRQADISSRYGTPQETLRPNPSGTPGGIRPGGIRRPNRVSTPIRFGEPDEFSAFTPAGDTPTALTEIGRTPPTATLATKIPDREALDFLGEGTSFTPFPVTPAARVGIHETGGAPAAPAAQIRGMNTGVEGTPPLPFETLTLKTPATDKHEEWYKRMTGGSIPAAPAAPAATTVSATPGTGTNQSVTTGQTMKEFLEKNAPGVAAVTIGGQAIGRPKQLAGLAGIIHPSSQAWKNMSIIERETLQAAVKQTGLPWSTFLDEAGLTNVLSTQPGLRGRYSMAPR